MTYQSLNPATGKLLKKFDELTDKQLEDKLAAAEKCFKTWKLKTYAERAVIVARAAALLHERVDELAHTMTLEMGKRISEAKGKWNSVRISSRITPRMPSASLPTSNCIRHSATAIWKAARSA